MALEDKPVLIVGAGPAGLVLALSLAQHCVRSIIIEKEKEVTEDPRGVYLAGDAVRILYQIGLGKYMKDIGHELPAVNFHTTDFKSPPFLHLDLSGDMLNQSVPTGILQIQPELGCTVVKIHHTEPDEFAIEYEEDCNRHLIEGSWIIGADGKRGIVRKKFLEIVADIRQVDSGYHYEDTWVAANLKIKLPTPSTHPNFACWQEGMSPEEVYDLFWPKNWHFCSPPGKPTASGRFGPYESRLWRHEFKQSDWTDDLDAEALLWEHLMPMLKRINKPDGSAFKSGPVEFPKDCIEILRCRPFRFSHKIVNRWFWKRCVLIGDAAHVFPPFGGQGIASGIRDAHQLAWRIALIHSATSDLSTSQTEAVLNAWAAERTTSVKQAATVTQMNGVLCNEERSYLVITLRLFRWLAEILSLSPSLYDPQIRAELNGFQDVAGGFFLKKYNGGKRMPQIFLDSMDEREILSDRMFSSTDSPLRVIAFVNGMDMPPTSVSQIRSVMASCHIPSTILSPDSIALLSLKSCRPESIGHYEDYKVRKYCASPRNKLTAQQAKRGYDELSFKQRLGANVRFVIVRPDFYVFASASTLDEFSSRLQDLKTLLF